MAFKVVMRLEPIQPKDVAGFMAHGNRKIGDLTHIVGAKSELRAVMIGDDSFAKEIIQLSDDMAKFNRHSSLAKRKFRNLKEANEAIEKTPLKNPWRENLKSKGPLREGILSVRRDFFEADEKTKPEDCIEYLDDKGIMTIHDRQKYRDFYKVSKRFLKETFGSDCPYARYDGDEQAAHVHFILCRTVDLEPTVRYPLGRRVFRINEHPLVGESIRDENGQLITATERLQDAVGKFFEEQFPEMGIVRGDRRAAEKREMNSKAKKLLNEAKERGEEIPSGSENAQALYLLRKSVAEAEEAKRMGRKDTRGRIAIEYLVALGVLSEDVFHEKAKRREIDAILRGVEAIYGTREQIIENPERVADIYVQIAKDRTAADAKTVSDALSKREAALVKREAEIARREKAMGKREVDLNSKSADLDSKEISLAKRKDELASEEEKLGIGKANYNRAATQLRAAYKHSVETDKRINKLVSMLEKDVEIIRPMVEKSISDRFEKNIAEAKSGSPYFTLGKDVKLSEALKLTAKFSNSELCDKATEMDLAQRLIEDPEYQLDAKRGFLVLEEECKLRGIDYKSRKQDKSKAKDKARADLHADPLTQHVEISIGVNVIVDHSRGAR